MAISWRSAYADLMTQEERRRLEDYIALCDSLRTHRFVNETVELTLKLGKTPSAHSLLGYDEDLLKSFLMDFRKLVMNDERTHFQSVANVIARRRTSMQAKVKDIKKRYERKLKSSPILLEAGDKRADIVDAWLNGHYFHQDQTLKSAILEEAVIRKQQFITAVIDLTGIAQELGGIARKALGVKIITTQKDGSPASRDANKIVSDISVHEIGGIAKKLSSASPDGDAKLDNFEQIRLFLYASGTLYSNSLNSEILGNHELHIAYSFKEKVHPFFSESWLILKTMVSDRWNQKAGWYWYPRMTKKTLVEFAIKYFLHSENEDVRYGVISILEKFWEPSFISHLEKLATDESKDIRQKVLEILKKNPSARVLPVLAPMLKDKDEYITKNAFSLHIQVLISTDHQKALSLIKVAEKFDDYHVENLDLLFRKLTRQEVQELASSDSQILNIYAHVELIRRRVLKIEQIESLLQHDIWSIRYIALKELLRRGKSFSISRVNDVLKDDAKGASFSRYAYGLSDLEKEDILRAIHESKTADELEQMVDWSASEGALWYEMMGNKSFEKRKKQIREDLRTNFEERRKEWQARSVSKFKMTLEEFKKIFDQYEDFITGQFRTAALRILLENGSAQDVTIARTLAITDSYDVKRLSVQIIKKYGSAKDAPFLLDLARAENSYNRTAIKAALELDKNGKNHILRLALESDNDVHVKKAIAFAYHSGKTINKNNLEKFLKHDDLGIRAAAVAYICHKFTREQMQQLLKDYISGHYFYNVVCWLDRVLYAPEPIRKQSLAELKEKLLWIEDDDSYSRTKKFFIKQIQAKTATAGIS